MSDASWTTWSHESPAEQAVIRAKVNGYQIAAIELAANSVRLEAFIQKVLVCVALGGEFDVVSQEVANLTAVAIERSMHGIVNSINVSKTATIALYMLSWRAEAAGSSAVAWQDIGLSSGQAPAS